MEKWKIRPPLPQKKTLKSPKFAWMHPQSGMVIVLIVFEVYACQSSVRILDKCIQRAVAKEICKVYEDYDKLSVTILRYYTLFSTSEA